MKQIWIIAMLLLVGCSKDREPSLDCVDPSKKGEFACPAYIDPVCGCNNVTYGNSCEASSAGVLKWTKGSCK